MLKITLCTLWPFLFFYSETAGDTSQAQSLITYFLITLAVFLIMFHLAKKIASRSFPGIETRRLADVFSIAILTFFNFGLFQRINLPSNTLFNHNSILQLFLWLVSLLVLCGITWRLSTHRTFSRFLFLVSLFLAALPLASIGIKSFSGNHNPSSELSAVGSDVFYETPIRRPNIYYFVLDAYARNDVIKEQTGHDNSFFLEELRKRGFYVAERSLSNFPTTYLSVSSTLESNYLVQSGMNQFRDRKSFEKILQGNNSIVRFFQKAGYTYIHYQNDLWNGSRCGGHEEICIRQSRSIRFNGPAEAIISRSALWPFWNKVKGLMDPYPGSGLTRLMDEMNKLSREKSPFFLFAHILKPHAPSVFNDDCSLRKEYGSAKDRSTYGNEVRCFNSEILESIDRILKTDKNAIIIMNGDHGTNFQNQFLTPIRSWSHEQIHERFSILNIYRLPEDCNQLLYPSISPVNTMRVVAACLSKTPPQLLPDRHFIVTYEDNSDFGDVVETGATP